MWRDVPLCGEMCRDVARCDVVWRDVPWGGEEVGNLGGTCGMQCDAHHSQEIMYASV